MSHPSFQSGFAVVEAVLIAVIVGIIGFTGWFVLHSKQSADRSLTNASKTISAAKANSSKYITIKEWGVRAPYAGSLQLSYKIENTEAIFSSKSLTDLYASCAGYAGSINRIDMEELSRLGQDGPFGAPGVTTKILNNFGYQFIHAQSVCSGPVPADAQFKAHESQITAELTKANDAVKSLVENLQLLRTH